MSASAAGWQQELYHTVRFNNVSQFYALLARQDVRCEIRAVSEWLRDGWPLHSAAFNGRTEMLKRLLDAGVQVASEAVDQPGLRCTALHRAVAGGQTAAVRLLLERGARGDRPVGTDNSRGLHGK